MADAFIPLHALKGRGAATRLPHRFERDVRDAFDDGWGTLEEDAAEADELPPLATEVRFEDVEVGAERKRFARHSLRPLAQPVPRLRARLHLLLRAAHAQLPQPLARARLRDQADRQAQHRRGAARRTGPQELPAQPDRDRHRDRLLPAHRARTAPHALGDRGAEGNAPPLRPRHQVQRGRARPRPDRADGGRAAGRGLHHHHHARRRTRAQAGAARRRAAPAPAHHSARWPMPACRWA